MSSRVPQEGGHFDLWITDLEHSTDSRFTFDPSDNRDPVSSPDGTKVVFRSSRGGGISNLWQRAANGTGKDELLFESKENKMASDRVPGWALHYLH